MDQKTPNPCSKLNQIIGSHNFDKDYEVCMKATLPRANVGRFKYASGQLKLDAFEKEYESKEEASYKSACTGDSGSGHWVTVNPDTDDEQRALVAVYSHDFKGHFSVNGKTVPAVCGSSLTLSSGEKLLRGAASTITTHTRILTFIKKWAGI